MPSVGTATACLDGVRSGVAARFVDMAVAERAGGADVGSGSEDRGRECCMLDVARGRVEGPGRDDVASGVDTFRLRGADAGVLQRMGICIGLLDERR